MRVPPRYRVRRPPPPRLFLDTSAAQGDGYSSTYTAPPNYERDETISALVRALNAHAPEQVRRLSDCSEQGDAVNVCIEQWKEEVGLPIPEITFYLVWLSLREATSSRSQFHLLTGAEAAELDRKRITLQQRARRRGSVIVAHRGHSQQRVGVPIATYRARNRGSAHFHVNKTWSIQCSAQSMDEVVRQIMEDMEVGVRRELRAVFAQASEHKYAVRTQLERDATRFVYRQVHRLTNSKILDLEAGYEAVAPNGSIFLWIDALEANSLEDLDGIKKSIQRFARSLGVTLHHSPGGRPKKDE